MHTEHSRFKLVDRLATVLDHLTSFISENVTVVNIWLVWCWPGVVRVSNDNRLGAIENLIKKIGRWHPARWSRGVVSRRGALRSLDLP